MNKPMWQPPAASLHESAMHRFMQQAARQHGFPADYDSLHRWSITEPAAFWSAVWEFTDIRASQRWVSVLENPTAMPGARWFVGSRLNFAENLLRHRDEHRAIVFRDEAGGASELTYRQLYDEVARVSALLRELGVQPGERVVGYLANCPQAVIGMLATAAIGAVWSSCSPDFGAKGAVERFAQITPKVLFTIDGYRYNGKQFDVLDAAAELVESLPSIQRVIVVSFLNPTPTIDKLPGAMLFDDYTTDQREIDFKQLPFDHPLYILYSSGTTGAPKCIVHSAGGTLIQHLKEHRLHLDLTRQDVMLYITTCGWMMWNWLVSGLASGATLVLYDGAPMHPNPHRMWRLAEQLRISIFGTSASYITALAKAEARPNQHNLTALRTILSTGSPLSATGYDYVHHHIKPDAQLASISGGTDIVSCFVLGNPILPVHRGEIQSRGLGMAVQVYAANATPAATGEAGELVCTKPFPSMPIGFWNEPDQQRYRAAYFSRFPNVWAQGDHAEITINNGIIIHGRSDATLNPGGVRIGTAEIYRQVEKIPEVLESICVSQNWDGDTRIILFVVLRANITLTQKLKTTIRTTIAQNTTRRHIPKIIIAVPDIPKTRSGKIVELAVKNIIHNHPITPTQSLANPQSLTHFQNLPQLQQP